jgi:toxin HigB-1
MVDVSRIAWHIASVIVSFANRATERFAREGKSKFRGLDVAKAMARMQVLHAAASLDEIPPLKSVGLHPLVGDRQGQWAMTINGPWRLVFRFRDGNAEDVEIVDYH